MLAVRAPVRVAQRAQPVHKVIAVHECTICRDTVAATAALCCDDNAQHCICADCLREYIDRVQGSKSFQEDSHIPCIIPQCRAQWTNRNLISLASEPAGRAVLEHYDALRQSVRSPIRAAQRVRPAQHAVVMHDCTVCQESVDGAAVLRCTADASHGICTGCLPRHIDMIQASKSFQADSRIPCIMPQCRAHWTSKDLISLVIAHHTGRTVFEHYDAIKQQRIAALSKVVQQQEQRAVAAARTQVAAAALQRTRQQELDARIHRHRRHIAEQLLTLHCPACRTAFIDYDGCDALQCGSCKTNFCALCLHNGGDDVHPHVYQQHGQVYGGLENFNLHHRTQRRRKVVQYINELAVEIRAAVLKECQTDLTHLRIQIAVADVTPAIVPAAVQRPVAAAPDPVQQVQLAPMVQYVHQHAAPAAVAPARAAIVDNVFISPSGECYHRATCRYAVMPMERHLAVAQRYRPCKVCRA